MRTEETAARMRIYLTGASGFVGSNLAHVFAHDHGAEVVAPGHEHVDLTDELVVRRSVAATRPDALVHAAIWNDPVALTTDRRRAWDAYVGATRNVVAAANAVDAHVRADLDRLGVRRHPEPGARGRATQSRSTTTGSSRRARSWSLTESAGRGTVARIAGVQGIHRARPHTPRAQDAGFGYLVASLVDALRAGESLRRLGRTRDQPAGHADARHRRRRARVACARARGHRRSCTAVAASTSTGWSSRAVRPECSSSIPDLLDVVAPPDRRDRPPSGSPRDTRLNAARHRGRPRRELPDLTGMLARLRRQMESSWSLA